MKLHWFRILFVTCLALQLAQPTAAFAQPIPAPVPDSNTPLSVSVQNQETPAAKAVLGEIGAGENEVATYIVRLKGEPLASYQGDLPGLAATSPSATGEGRLNLESQAAAQYRSYLAEKRQGFTQATTSLFKEPLDVLYTYDVAFNGLAVRTTPARARQLLKNPNVAAVYRDQLQHVQAASDANEYLDVPDIWSGTGLPSGSQGDGVIVGIIDTGIWPEHPSFRDDGTYPTPPAKWKGSCTQPADDTLGYTCNNKLIGIQYFLTSYAAGPGGYDGLFLSGRDDEGHGTHTASTAAGNKDVHAFLYGEDRGTVSGVAPRAHVAAYKVLGPQGGYTSDLVSAINKAVADGVDVINYSIGSSTARDPWASPDALAFLNARDAGVFVAVSAGNDGPTASTIGSPANAPWVTSVGASQHDLSYWSTLTLTVEGESPATYTAGSISPAVNNFTLVLPSTNASCDTPFDAGTFSATQMVICPRGGIGTPGHIDNVKVGGGGAVLHYGAATSLDMNMSLYTLPSYMVHYDVGQEILTKVNAAKTAGKTITVSATRGEATAADATHPGGADLVVGFSSRGPNINEDSGELISTLKPDVTAPGYHILAGASPQFSGEGQQNELFQAIQGTSMSSPHVAGMGALIKALHPTWTPSEIQSALMLTAKNTGQTQRTYKTGGGYDDSIAATPFDYGAGRTQPLNAIRAGFILEETNFEKADPAAGGDPSSLNLASLTQTNCLGTCTWTRTVKRADPASAIEWTATPSANVSVSPDKFTLNDSTPTQILTFTANVSTTTPGSWLFDQVSFSGSGQTLHFTVAARSVSGLAPSTFETFTRRNAGNTTLKDLKALNTGALSVITYSVSSLNNRSAYAAEGIPAIRTFNLTAAPKGVYITITGTTAIDADLYVGYDADGGMDADASELLCSSATVGNNETCILPVGKKSLSAGLYWIYLDVYQGSGAGADEIQFAYGVATNDDGESPLKLDLPPAAITAKEAFNLDFKWNLPALTAGTTLPTWAEFKNDGTIFAETCLLLTRLADDVTQVITLPASTVIEPGDEVPLKISVTPDPNILLRTGAAITYHLTAALPAGLSYVAGSASQTPGGSGSQLTWDTTLSSGTNEITYKVKVDPTLTTPGPLQITLDHQPNSETVFQLSTTLNVQTFILDVTGNIPDVPSGTPFQINLTVKNDGQLPASNVIAKAHLPLGLDYQSGGSYDSGTKDITWTIPSIAARGSQVVSFTATAGQLYTLPKSGALAPLSAPIEKIIGGGPADIANYPFQVGLLLTDYISIYGQRDAQYCAGVIIHPEWVLTAAHCVYTTGSLAQPGEITILAGTSTLSGTGVLDVVDRVIAHEAYVPGVVDSSYDIALLHLKDPLTPSSTPPIAIARLATPNDASYFAPSTATMDIGWGKTSVAPATYPDQLQQVQMTLQSNETCSALLTSFFGTSTPISEHMICSGTPLGTQSVCSGDSGGPTLVSDGSGGWLVVGLHSWGATACSAGSSVSTRVSQFIDWIQRAMNRYALSSYSVNTTVRGAAASGEVIFSKEIQQQTIWAGSSAQGSFIAQNQQPVSLVVPSGSTGQSVQVVYSPLSQLMHPLGSSQKLASAAASQPFYLSVTREGAIQEHFTFSKPIEWTFNVGSLPMEGALNLLVWNGSQWTASGSTVKSRDLTHHTLTVSVSKPGEYALGYAPNVVFLPNIAR